jgi:cell division septation protein DedD
VDSKRASSATSTPAAGESDASAGAWVVQLGSFASRANAEHLAQQVRSQGFEVSVSQSSSGRHLFRVRVGAAKTQAGALALEQKLRALGHGGGTVLPKQGGA